jgi:hypothetical protein
VLFKIKINFNPKLITKAVTIIKQGKLKINYVAEILLKPTQTIAVKKISFVFTPKEILKGFVTITIKQPMVFVSKAIQKATTHIAGGKLVLILNATPASYFTLGHFDPSSLGTLDSLTLGDMDYVLV